MTTGLSAPPAPAPSLVAPGGDADAPAVAISVEVALGAASLVGAAAVARLVAGGWSGPAWWPVMTTTAAGYLIMVGGLRRRFSPPLVASAAVVVVALVSVAGAVPGATRFGLPTGRAPHGVDLALGGVRDAVGGWHWPLAAPPGVVLVAALVAGLAAVAARACAGPPARWRPAAGLVPPLVLVTASAMAVADAGAAWAVAGLVVAGGATLLAGNRSLSPDRGPERRQRRLGAGLVGLALAATAGTALIVGSPGRSSSGAGPGGSGAAITPTGLALATDLVGLEQRDPRVVLFHARTPTNTYWQLGLVTDWRDGEWVPDAATQAVLGTAPGSLRVATAPVPTPRGTFQVQVTMAALSSRLLPAPPGAVSVTPSGRAQVTAIGVVAPTAPRSGEAYGVIAAVAPSVTDLDLGPDDGAPPPAYISPADLQAARVVPPVPASVLALARQVTAGAATPLARAEALVDWFRSGAFRYTLDPPPTPKGADPLVAFLTTTRAGTCESFASAFTVLARAVGLPTRIAIGFTGGTRGSDGTTTVRGADAHAWPEVELGSAGWVSFEPTPQLPSGELSPADVVGPTALTAPTTAAPPTTARPTPPVTRPGGSVPTTAPAPPTTAATPTTPTTAAPSTTASAPPPTVDRHPRHGWLIGAGAVLAVIGLIALAGLVAAVHRGRQRRARAGWAHEGLLGSYRRAVQPLAGTPWARPGPEPPSVHARRLRELVDRPDGPGASAGTASAATTAQLDGAVAELIGLADLLERQLYASRPPSPDDTAWAVEAATRVRATLADPRLRVGLSSPPAGLSSPTG